jgi:hypothetical protein
VKKDGFNVEGGLEALEKVKAITDRAAKGNDADAKIMGVMSAFLGKVGAEGKALVALSNKLGELNVFDLSTYKTKEAIAERRKLAGELIAKNKSFLAVFTTASSYLRAELNRVGIPAARADAQIRGFENGQQRQLPAVIKVRQADIAIAGIIIELCDLTEAEAGKFETNQAGKVYFENRVAMDKYNALAARLAQTEEDQKKAQESLFANAKR